MYRKSLLCLFAVGAVAISCGDDDPPSGDGGGHEQGGSAGKAGSAGKGGSSGTNEGGEAGADTGGTGGKGTTGGTGGKGTTGGTGTGGSGATGEGGAGNGGGGNAEPCENGNPPQCADSATIMLCDPEAGSTMQPFSCRSDFCSSLGLASGPCVEDGADTTCRCGAPVDAECFAGAEEVCSCLQGTDVECTSDADLFAWYRACVDGEAESEDLVRCFAANSARACSRTVEECVP